MNRLVGVESLRLSLLLSRVTSQSSREKRRPLFMRKVCWLLKVFAIRPSLAFDDRERRDSVSTQVPNWCRKYGDKLSVRTSVRFFC